MPSSELHSQLIADGPERLVVVAELAIARFDTNPEGLSDRGFDQKDADSDPFNHLSYREHHLGSMLLQCIVKHEAREKSERSMQNAVREWRAQTADLSNVVTDSMTVREAE